MTIPPELEAQILRYHHVEKWRVGTIARQLHVHHGTVTRVLAQAGLPRTDPPRRRSQVEPYLPFIFETLQKFPALTARHLSDQALDAVDDLDREAGVEKDLAHQNKERDGGERKIHHGGDAVANELVHAGIATEKQCRADEVDGDEGERGGIAIA